MILAAACEIRGLLRYPHGAQVISAGVPDPNALRSGNVQVPAPVDSDSIGHAVVLAAWFLAEDAAVAKGSVGSSVVDADVLFLTVVDVEVFAVGTEGQTVRLGQIPCKLPGV